MIAGHQTATAQVPQRTVVPVASACLPTHLGRFRISGYRSTVTADEFVAIWTGELRPDADTLTRIHSQCLTSEVFGSLRCDCAGQLNAAMELIAREGSGIVVYQFQEGRGIGILNKIRAYALQDGGDDTVEANRKLGFPVDLRTFSQCAEVLLDLNVRRVRLISNNPQKILALHAAGIEVVERVSPPMETPAAASRYMKTKREKMGHLIDPRLEGSPSDWIAELIRARRSAFEFSTRDVDPAVVLQLLDSARWAPSSFNEQPWRFIVAIRSRQQEAFEKMLSCVSAHNRAWAEEAPVLIMTVAKLVFERNGKTNRHALHDVGLAMSNFALQAAALNLDVHQMGGFDVEAALKAFQIQDEYIPTTISALGYATYPPKKPSERHPLDELVYWGEWPQTKQVQ